VATPSSRGDVSRASPAGLPPSCSAPAPCIWATWLEHRTRRLDCCWAPFSGGSPAGRPPRCVKLAEAGTLPRGPHREPLGFYLPHCIARVGPARHGGLFVCRAAAACATESGWSRGRRRPGPPLRSGAPERSCLLHCPTSRLPEGPAWFGATRSGQSRARVCPRFAVLWCAPPPPSGLKGSPERPFSSPRP